MVWGLRPSIYKALYLGNVRDNDAATVRCAGCGCALVEHEGYRLSAYRVTAHGTCLLCDRPVAGIWDPAGPPPDTGFTHLRGKLKQIYSM